MFDITIIGGGPVGLYGLFYAGLRGMKAKLIDALPELGGQLVTLYPEKYIYDVAGFPKILARDLAKNLISQALSFNPEVFLGERVVSIEQRQNDGRLCYRLLTEGGNEHFTSTIILTAGIGAFRPRKLPIPELDRFEGNGVHYFVNEKGLFKGKKVLIVGGGDSAVDWALNLLGTANKITLIHRRDKFRAHEKNVAQLMNSPVDVMTYHELKRVIANEKIEKGVIYDNRTLEEKTLEIDAIILNLGFQADLGPLKNWGLDLDRTGIKVNYRMETNLPGIFAAGDIASHPGKLKLISTGFGEVATAVNFAKNYIDPDSKVFPGHSSDLSLG
ncbi:MAG: NAD(P)/FAD-dependent oxidoreductase [Candidatus Kryptoniota bacterium]